MRGGLIMAKNNTDQAPKIRSVGEKSPDILSKGRTAWGNAIRPHELETIFANCLDSRAFAQYKVMMFLTGCAEEKFDVSLKNVMNRCGLSKDAYYKARIALINKGWLSMEETGDKVYITIHYDKIYQDGKECTSLNYTHECNCKTTTDEGNCKNTPDEEEGKLNNYSVRNESNSENSSHPNEGKLDNYTDRKILKDSAEEGNSENSSVRNESKIDNYTLEEGNCKTTYEGNCKTYYEGKLQKSQYNIDNNNIEDNITDSNLRDRFDEVWNNESKSRLKGAAARF
jgi:hypothetical protein